MNKRITKLFSCCLDNRVVVFETNLDKFHEQLKNIEPNCNYNRWYAHKFKQDPEFSQTIDGKTYYFQRLV